MLQTDSSSPYIQTFRGSGILNLKPRKKLVKICSCIAVGVDGPCISSQEHKKRRGSGGKCKEKKKENEQRSLCRSVCETRLLISLCFAWWIKYSIKETFFLRPPRSNCLRQKRENGEIVSELKGASVREEKCFKRDEKKN